MKTSRFDNVLHADDGSLPRYRTVADVMTARVHVASPMTPFKLLVRLIEENHISVVPVVDQHGVPVGVVSEADLLLKARRTQLETFTDLDHLRRGRTERTQAQGVVAADLMTSPPITIRVDEPLGDAAQRMHERHVKRLVVVDERGKIAGVVSRSDLLQSISQSADYLDDAVKFRV